MEERQEGGRGVKAGESGDGFTTTDVKYVDLQNFLAVVRSLAIKSFNGIDRQFSVRRYIVNGKSYNLRYRSWNSH